jgi:hypothetical protein
MNPYFLWNVSIFGKPAATAISAFIAFLATALMVLFRSYEWPRKWEALGVALVGFFLLYITVQSRLDGGHSKWIVACFILFGLIFLALRQRVQVLYWFSTFFALSVLPGVLVSLWMALNLPVTFDRIPAANPLMALHQVYLLHVPGAVFTESNVLIFPYGGALFRLNGMFDEPGMVGTIAAFLLAGYRFKLDGWRPALIYVAGLLSCSLAFVVLSAIGLVGAFVLRRGIYPLVLLIPVLFIAGLLFNVFSFRGALGTTSSVSVEAVHAGQAASTVEPVKDRGQELRLTERVDNRALPEMQALLKDYWASGPKTLIFGIASDASVVNAPTSQVWTRVLTNHGFLGFALLVAGFSSLGWSAWIRANRSPWVLLFGALFVASFYQRPVIWLPYALLLFLCISPFAERHDPDTD